MNNVCADLPCGVQADKENFCNSVRAEVKSAGILDSTPNCWAFFIDKVCCYILSLLSFTAHLPVYQNKLKPIL